MSIDYEFVVDMLTRYGKHLVDVQRACQANVRSYQLQKIELERLAEKYPERYLSRLEEITSREANTQTTLDIVNERLDKIPQQVEAINKEFSVA